MRELELGEIYGKKCSHIDKAIELALTCGNSVYCVTEKSIKNEKKIVDMNYPLSPELKKMIELSLPTLSFWHFKGGSHNPSEEGFTCDACKAVLIFPNVKTPRVTDR